MSPVTAIIADNVIQRKTIFNNVNNKRIIYDKLMVAFILYPFASVS